MSRCKCHDKLAEAKAELEYLKSLPDAAFQTTFGSSGTIIAYSADNKAYAVQIATAKVKRLKVLTSN